VGGIEERWEKKVLGTESLGIYLFSRWSRVVRNERENLDKGMNGF